MAKATKLPPLVHIQNNWCGILKLKKEMRLRLWNVPAVYKNEYLKFKLKKHETVL